MHSDRLRFIVSTFYSTNFAKTHNRMKANTQAFVKLLLLRQAYKLLAFAIYSQNKQLETYGTTG